MLSAALLTILLAAPGSAARPPAGGPGVHGAPIFVLAAKRGTAADRPAGPTATPAPPAAASKRQGDWPGEPSGKTVTIDEESSLDDALGKIAEAAGWNLVANTGRIGDRKLVVAVRKAPVEEALEAVLEGSPLVATRRGNTVTVAPRRAAASLEQPVLSGFEKPTGKRFTGDFTETPVGEALRKVSDAAGLSIVFPPGLRGTVSGHFRESPVEDVLRAILAQAGLVASREGSILTVSREGGPSLVIRGSKRGLAFQLEDADSDLGREIDDAGRDAARDTGSRDQGAGGDQRSGGKKRRARASQDRVLHGDQVIGPGERTGEVVVLGGNVRLESGAVAKQVTTIKGSVNVGPGASVEREVVAIGGDIHVAPGARIGADAVSIGGKIVIDQGGEVQGGQTSIKVPGLAGLLGLVGTGTWWSEEKHDSALWRLGSALGQFVVFFLLGLLVLLLFPRRLEGVTGSLVNAPLKAVVTGVLGTIALPIVILLLAVSVIGIPFIAVVALGLGAAAVLGYTALALRFGRALPFRLERGAHILHLAIGTAALVVLGQVPVLGCLAWIAGWLFVFGVVLRTRFGQPPSAPPAVYGTTAPPVPPQATGTGNP
jgi:hypothetical protein